MNTYLKSQINNMTSSVKIFMSGCELAVMQDDGRIDRKEQRILNRLRKASERYQKALDRIAK